MATPHALEPGGHSNTPNSTQKNKNKQTKKKGGGKAIPICIRKYYFFFPVHMVATALKEDINIPALTA